MKRADLEHRSSSTDVSVDTPSSLHPHQLLAAAVQLHFYFLPPIPKTRSVASRRLREHNIAGYPPCNLQAHGLPGSPESLRPWRGARLWIPQSRMRNCRIRSLGLVIPRRCAARHQQPRSNSVLKVAKLQTAVSVKAWNSTTGFLKAEGGHQSGLRSVPPRVRSRAKTSLARKASNLLTRRGCDLGFVVKGPRGLRLCGPAQCFCALCKKQAPVSAHFMTRAPRVFVANTRGLRLCGPAPEFLCAVQNSSERLFLLDL